MKKRIVSTVLIAITLAATPVMGQSWKPEKNIEILIGLTPGSSQDRTGRSLQKAWQETKAINTSIGVPVNVVNRPGGGGQIALTALTQHAGDPHYFYIASPTIITRYITGLGTFQSNLNSANFLKHLHAEDKRLRSALTDLGLAKQ